MKQEASTNDDIRMKRVYDVWRVFCSRMPYIALQVPGARCHTTVRFSTFPGEAWHLGGHFAAEICCCQLGLVTESLGARPGAGGCADVPILTLLLGLARAPGGAL